jgi:hypothetical protein
MPDFIPFETPVNTFLLDGEACPGLVKFEGLDTPRKWEGLTGPGLTGEILRFLGNKNCEFTGHVYLYTRDHFIKYRPFLQNKLLRAPAGKYPKVWPFWHPWADLVGINQVVVLNASAPMLVEPAGYWISKINFKEQRKVKFTYSKPEPAAARPPDDPNDIANAAKRAELDALNAENETIRRRPTE